MKKQLLLLIILTQIAKSSTPPINYGLYKGSSIFPTWTGEYDSEVKNAKYNEYNPPISRAPSAIWGTNKAPYPTNRWFTTLAISGNIAYTESGTHSFTQPFSVITFPYIIQALTNHINQEKEQVYPSLRISVPEKQYITFEADTSTAYTCSSNSCDQKPLDVSKIQAPQGSPTPNYPFTASFLNVTPYSLNFSCLEQAELEEIPFFDEDTPEDPFALNKNLFGVKLLFKLKNEKSNIKKERFSSSLVRGMPFVSAEFENLTPFFEFPGQAVLRFCNEANLQDLQNNKTIPLIPTALTGTSFIIQLNSSQTWFVFTSSPITLTYNSTANTIQSNAPFNGLVQVINYTIPQIQPPAIPLPLKPTDNWQTQGNTTYTSYEEYFQQNFFPAVETWYSNTYLGTEYYNQMPALNLPKNNGNINTYDETIYNYYTNTYYETLETDLKKDSSPKSEKNLNNFILSNLKKMESYSGIYPTGGTIEFSQSENQPGITISWQTNIPATTDKKLLMLSLPHHQDLFANPQYDESIHYDSIRGTLFGTLGTQWRLNYQNPGVSWYAKNDTNIRNTNFQKALTSYLEKENTTVTASDSYGFGKEVSRLARLALIAQQINQPDLTKSFLSAIKASLDPWIKKKNTDPLFYDPQWGGVCTKNGLESHEQDYGMGWYNDHHFHFGYFIYAAAVYLHLADLTQETDSKFDPMLIQFTQELIRDIANPNSDDESFPYFRLMDWYLWHSLAAGIFPFGNGKNQESTSEAVNAWYGIYLFGLATNNQNLEALGNTLLASEINAAQTYWYMMPEGPDKKPSINSGIYPDIFNKLACVGVLWETKADYATFFGSNVEYINLIHFLPFTPATEALIPTAWNDYQYQLLEKSLTRTIDPVTKEKDPLQSAWRGFVYMSEAISGTVNSINYTQQAFESFINEINTSKLQPIDNGNSATNMLYWLLTRPNFTPNGNIPNYQPTQPSKPSTPSSQPTPSKPSSTPSSTPTSKTITPVPAQGRIVPGLPATPQEAESMGYVGASKSISAYIDYIKTTYLAGIINWYIQTYPSKFPSNISLSFDGSTPEDVYKNFANSDFYQTLVKHYNKHNKTPYFDIPQGAAQPPLPGIPENWPTNYLNNFITQTFIATWYEPNLGTYKGYNAIPAETSANELYQFLIDIYAPAYLKWIKKLNPNPNKK